MEYRFLGLDGFCLNFEVCTNESPSSRQHLPSTSPPTRSPINFTIRGFRSSSTDAAFLLHDFIRLRYFSLRRPSFVEVLELAAPLRPHTFTKSSMLEYLETISLQDWVLSSKSFVASLDGRQQILSTSDFFATAFGSFFRSGVELPSSFFQSMLSAHLAIGQALMSSQPELLPPSWSAASPPTIASVNQSFSQLQPAFTACRDPSACIVIFFQTLPPDLALRCIRAVVNSLTRENQLLQVFSDIVKIIRGLHKNKPDIDVIMPLIKMILPVGKRYGDLTDPQQASTRLRLVESIVFQLFAMSEPESSPDFDKITESALSTLKALSISTSAALSTASSPTSSSSSSSASSSGGSVPAPALTLHQRNAMLYMADYFQTEHRPSLKPAVASDSAPAATSSSSSVLAAASTSAATPSSSVQPPAPVPPAAAATSSPLVQMVRSGALSTWLGISTAATAIVATPMELTHLARGFADVFRRHADVLKATFELLAREDSQFVPSFLAGQARTGALHTLPHLFRTMAASIVNDLNLSSKKYYSVLQRAAADIDKLLGLKVFPPYAELPLHSIVDRYGASELVASEPLKHKPLPDGTLVPTNEGRCASLIFDVCRVLEAVLENNPKLWSLLKQRPLDPDGHRTLHLSSTADSINMWQTGLTLVALHFVNARDINTSYLAYCLAALMLGKETHVNLSTLLPGYYTKQLCALIQKMKSRSPTTLTVFGESVDFVIELQFGFDGATRRMILGKASAASNFSNADHCLPTQVEEATANLRRQSQSAITLDAVDGSVKFTDYVTPYLPIDATEANLAHLHDCRDPAVPEEPMVPSSIITVPCSLHLVMRLSGNGLSRILNMLESTLSTGVMAGIQAHLTNCMGLSIFHKKENNLLGVSMNGRLVQRLVDMRDNLLSCSCHPLPPHLRPNADLSSATAEQASEHFLIALVEFMLKLIVIMHRFAYLHDPVMMTLERDTAVTASKQLIFVTGTFFGEQATYPYLYEQQGCVIKWEWGCADGLAAVDTNQAQHEELGKSVRDDAGANSMHGGGGASRRRVAADAAAAVRLADQALNSTALRLFTLGSRPMAKPGALDQRLESGQARRERKNAECWEQQQQQQPKLILARDLLKANTDFLERCTAVVRVIGRELSGEPGVADQVAMLTRACASTASELQATASPSGHVASIESKMAALRPKSQSASSVNLPPEPKQPRSSSSSSVQGARAENVDRLGDGDSEADLEFRRKAPRGQGPQDSSSSAATAASSSPSSSSASISSSSSSEVALGVRAAVIDLFDEPASDSPDQSADDDENDGEDVEGDKLEDALLAAEAEADELGPDDDEFQVESDDHLDDLQPQSPTLLSSASPSASSSSTSQLPSSAVPTAASQTKIPSTFQHVVVTKKSNFDGQFSSFTLAGQTVRAGEDFDVIRFRHLFGKRELLVVLQGPLGRFAKASNPNHQGLVFQIPRDQVERMHWQLDEQQQTFQVDLQLNHPAIPVDLSLTEGGRKTVSKALTYSTVDLSRFAELAAVPAGSRLSFTAQVGRSQPFSSTKAVQKFVDVLNILCASFGEWTLPHDWSSPADFNQQSYLANQASSQSQQSGPDHYRCVSSHSSMQEGDPMALLQDIASGLWLVHQAAQYGQATQFLSQCIHCGLTASHSQLMSLHPVCAARNIPEADTRDELKQSVYRFNPQLRFPIVPQTAMLTRQAAKMVGLEWSAYPTIEELSRRPGFSKSPPPQFGSSVASAPLSSSSSSSSARSTSSSSTVPVASQGVSPSSTSSSRPAASSFVSGSASRGVSSSLLSLPPAPKPSVLVATSTPAASSSTLVSLAPIPMAPSAGSAVPLAPAQQLAPSTISADASFAQLMDVLFGPAADRSPSAHRFLVSPAGQPLLAQLIHRVQHSSDADRISSLAALGNQWLLQPLPMLLEAAVTLHLLHSTYHNPQAPDLKRLAWAKIQAIVEKEQTTALSGRCGDAGGFMDAG